MRKNQFIFLTALVAAVIGTRANAALISATGQGLIQAPNAAVGYKANFFNDNSPNGIPVRAWDELQNVELQSDLLVDVNAMGTYQSSFASANGFIPRGTKVSSHNIYFDPKNSAWGNASFTFDGPILGIILLEGNNAGSNKFLQSDFLIPGSIPMANRSTTHFNARGIEFGPEVITWNTPNSLTLKLHASNPGDQIRVLTQAVPEPATMAFLMAGGLALVRKRRK